MADIAKVGNPSLSSTNVDPSKTSTGCVAGEALACFDAITLKADGKWWKADASADDELSRVRGYAMRAVAANGSFTVFHGGANVAYGSGMTPGVPVYLSVNAGLIADGTSTGAAAADALGYVFDATRIHFFECRQFVSAGGYF